MYKISSSSISRWLFYFFIISLFWSTRKIFNFSSIQNLSCFRENLTYSIFLFDLPLLLGIFWELFSVLKNKKFFIKPAKKNSASSLMSISYENSLTFLAIGLFFRFFWQPSGVSGQVLWRFLLASGLFFWLKQLFQKNSPERFFKNSLLCLFWSGLFQTVLASGQFFYQTSLNLSFLGESLLGKQILGVAKIEVAGEKFIRAYGTFPHPNLLGAFLFLSLAAGVYLFIHFWKKNLYQLASLFFLLGGIFLTFSRSTWLITAIFCFTVFLNIFLKKHPLSENNSFLKNNFTFSPKLIFSLLIIIPLLFGIFFFFSPFLKSRLCLKCANDSALLLRKEYAQTAQEIIFQKPLLGVGLGNFTLALPKFKPEIKKTPWNIQPVHNLYWLATAEAGLWILLFFVAIFFLTIKNFYQEKNYFSGVFLLFLLLGFFDHYFWTLAQGQLLFFLTLAFSAFCCRMKKLEKLQKS